MIIDYARLAEAERWYVEAGFALIEAPWLVGDAAVNGTRPDGARLFTTLGGNLVASAEQSFMQMMIEGRPPGRAVATTPCFRDEVGGYDELHFPYFVKTELIDMLDTSDESLARMIATARQLFERWMATRIERMRDGSFDIVEATTGIELGSYGRRTWRSFTWLYGTGLAEPRLGQAIEWVKGNAAGVVNGDSVRHTMTDTDTENLSGS